MVFTADRGSPIYLDLFASTFVFKTIFSTQKVCVQCWRFSCFTFYLYNPLFLQTNKKHYIFTTHYFTNIPFDRIWIKFYSDKCFCLVDQTNLICTRAQMEWLLDFKNFSDLFGTEPSLLFCLAAPCYLNPKFKFDLRWDATTFFKTEDFSKPFLGFNNVTMS